MSRREQLIEQDDPASEGSATDADVVFHHACTLGAEGIVSKRLGSRYRSGRSPDWLKFKNPQAEEDWGR